MARWRGNKPNRKGRNPTSRFVRLDHNSLLKTPAYRALSPNARSLYIELAMLENASNNGSLYLSVRDAAARMGVSDLTAASNAFDELCEAGFIALTCDATFGVKSSAISRARCWRLTSESTTNRAPTREFANRQPRPGTREHRRMERGLRALKRYYKNQSEEKMPVLESRTLDPLVVENVSAPVLDSNTALTQNSAVETELNVRDSATHSAAPWVEK